MDPSNILLFKLAGSEKDASDFAISGVLHQHDQTNTLDRGFLFRQMNNAERNYDIYDKELAVVESSSIGDTCCKVVSSSYCLVRSQESGILLCRPRNYSQTGSLVTGNSLNMLYDYSPTGKLTEERFTFKTRRYFLDSDQSNFQRIIDPRMFWISKFAMADLDSYVLVPALS
ncbi:hypothetical protein BASA81_017400 [Batrachochytrium salamandrivorans]|nr:hypothetical protein BASA81_017400 [Batrachochytrium salamandrivorans]